MAGVFLNLRQRLGSLHQGVIGPGLRHGVIGVCEADDSGEYGDILFDNPKGVTAPFQCS